MGLSREYIMALAREVGFDDAGICEVRTWPEMERLAQWLRRGGHGCMGFMARHEALRRTPELFFPGASSALMVVKSYHRPDLMETPQTGDTRRISRHAAGRDYHLVMRERLQPLAAALRTAGHSARPFVDTAPVMEKVLAARAGLGHLGRNTLLLHPRLGSWVVIAGLFTDAAWEPSDALASASPCRSCSRCLEACPAKALEPEGYLDARRCIACLTIEERGELAGNTDLGGWLYGCDVCQEVCPHNRGASAGASRDFEAPLVEKHHRREEILSLDEKTFEEKFGRTSIGRIGAARLKRNAKLPSRG